MTRPSKKEHERRLASRFLDGFVVHTSLDKDEKPDFRIRRTEGDIALEVTEYHSRTLEGGTSRPRLAMEVVWWRHVRPFVDRERQTRASLKNVQVYFRFSDPHLPRKHEGAAVARELVEAVQAVVADRRFRARGVRVEFVPRSTIESVGAFQDDGDVLLPTEDWPDITKRVQSLFVSRHSLEWPSWNCHNATISFLAPEVGEFKRILEKKAKAAEEYTLGSLPLWLLIVCDALDDGGEAHGDLASHIFPSTEAEKKQLADVLRQTGFDFQTGPFSEVWLFSCFTGDRRRLHPPG